MRLALVLSLFLFAACAGAPPADGTADIASLPVRGGVEAGSVVEASTPCDGSLGEALTLLAEGAVDPCSICAEKSRRKAFRILDTHVGPGTVLRSGAECRFTLMPGGQHELVLSSGDVGGEPSLIFRFHLPGDRLVGIAEADLTDEQLAAAVLGGAAVTAIRIAEYAYGDGPTYLYFPASNHLQVQCRILEIAAE